MTDGPAMLDCSEPTLEAAQGDVVFYEELIETQLDLITRRQLQGLPWTQGLMCLRSLQAKLDMARTVLDDGEAEGRA